MDKSTRDSLLADWYDKELSESEAEQLQSALRADNAFREMAAKELVVHRHLAQQRVPDGDFVAQVLGTLQRDDESDAISTAVIANLQLQKKRNRKRLFISLATGAAIMLAVGFFLNQPKDNRVRVIATEGIGTLKTERLYAGKRVRLGRGIIELELGNDARVVIEAPAAFDLRSPDHIYLNRGRCFAEMKKGTSGLVIETPTGRVLDLGTTFGVEVDDSKGMEVHVFDGKVELSRADLKKEIEQGDAIAFDEMGTRTEFDAVPQHFVSHIPRGTETTPDYMHWCFDEGVGSVVSVAGKDPNLALANGQLNGDGRAWVDGVHGSALAFDGASHWVDTGHPGISGSVARTVAAWVKIPANWGEHEKEAAPIMSWGKIDGESVGQGWMMSVGRKNKRDPEKFGRLRLSVGEQVILGTTDLRDGRWHHIAAVADSGENGASVLLYVDGNLENVIRNSIDFIDTEIGKASSETIRFGRQVFWDHLYMRGSLDDVWLFRAALSGDEIRALMNGEGAPSYTE